MTGMNTMKDTEETELDIDIDDIGTILKSSRLKNKKSLEDISSELCIRKIYLTALEEGDYETLPPIPYGVGYVRTYARYLGLNPERAVKLYKDASTVEDTAKAEEGTPEPEVNKSSKWHIIVSIVVLGAVYGMWNLHSSNNIPQNETLPQDEEVVISEAVSSEINESLSAITVVEVNPLSEDNSISPQTSEKIIDEGDTTIKDKAEKPDEEINALADKIVIEITGETWVELKDKNKVYVQGIFHKGDKKTINYAKNMFITVGRPQNIKISVKGVLKNIVAKNRKSNIPVDSLN